MEATSLYYPVASQDEFLDGMVDVVIREINRAVEPIGAASPEDWKRALRERILTAREVLRHPWAPHLIEKSSACFPLADAQVETVSGGGFPPRAASASRDR